MSEKLTMKDDIMFKVFFSKKGNEKYLREFLGAILGKEVKIKKIVHDARLEQLTKEQKYGVLDLEVELEDGRIINVEMQMQNNDNIEKRTTFYASKKITEQIAPNEAYNKMKNVIIIAILNYTLINLPEYITKTVRVADKHREYEINNEVTYYYIELDKFRKQKPDMKEPINQWLAFLDMKGELLEMAKKESKIIREAYGTYEVLTGDAEVKRLQEIRLMSILEEKSALLAAEKRGRLKGENIGRTEGESVGRKEEQKRIAKKLLEKNMEIEQIIEITKLSKEEIEAL